METLSNKNKSMNEFPLLDEKDGIPLFYPYISKNSGKEVLDTLHSRWIGQGPKVELFENLFQNKVTPKGFPIAVGSGTDALHLAYILCDIKEDDEVITPVFTCTATNLPLLYLKAKPIFADIDSLTMNIDVNDIEHRITSKTKAIIAVDYGGIPCDYEKLREICTKYKLKLIADCAQSIGTLFKGKASYEYADFTAYSFQAIKTITTADGGMLIVKSETDSEKAKRLRWFGIDRNSKQKGTWENDIYEIGYKYQMNDLSACLGISSLKELDYLISHRRNIYNIYKDNIQNELIKVIQIHESDNTKVVPWLCTLLVKKGRISLMEKLRINGVESAQVHYRNDRYSVFNGRKNDLPKMDSLEEKYIVIPLHHKVSEKSSLKICDIINNFSLT